MICAGYRNLGAGRTDNGETGNQVGVKVERKVVVHRVLAIESMTSSVGSDDRSRCLVTCLASLRALEASNNPINPTELFAVSKLECDAGSKNNCSSSRS